ncbi:unnamed protein product [Prorocentrum cordatum]|uniref:Uncharacterized protein n=1 Tax=Prorocentrum cordatum TaxID=2364126 RepID=A0ABN9QGV9_9DINO|nr:unnamed protein product [Polarella glacialis]
MDSSHPETIAVRGPGCPADRAEKNSSSLCHRLNGRQSTVDTTWTSSAVPVCSRGRVGSGGSGRRASAEGGGEEGAGVARRRGGGVPDDGQDAEPGSLTGRFR